MTDLRDAARQALNSLRGYRREIGCEQPCDAERALEAALEQPEHEPVANNPDPYHLSRILHELAGSASMCWEHVDRAGVFQSTQAADVVAAAIAELRQRMKVAPPRREWRGLTEEEVNALWASHDKTGDQITRAIEAALKERNA